MRATLIFGAVLIAARAGAAQDLAWHDSLEKAKATGKPVALLRILGDLDGKL